MIRFMIHDLKSTIDLFQNNDSTQLMRKCILWNSPSLIASLHQCFTHTKRSANHKINLAFSTCMNLFNVFTQCTWLNYSWLKSRGSCELCIPRMIVHSPFSDILAGYPRSSCGSYICQTTSSCLKPSFKIFILALISLSWDIPHTGHIHSLIDRSLTNGFLWPHAEQSWLLG